MKTENAKEFSEVSLIEGGPGDALMKRLRLIRPELGGASARTAIILAAVTWLPLLVFSLIEGLALGGARIPFLYDIAAHARFLVAVPVLVLAEFRSEGVCGGSVGTSSTRDSSAMRSRNSSQAASLMPCGFAIPASQG